MKVRFYVDPTTDASHVYGHGVSEHEVEEVLSRPAEDRPGQHGAGAPSRQTSGGRFLRVIYVPDPEPNSVFAITAYELRGKPLIAFRRRRRRIR